MIGEIAYPIGIAVGAGTAVAPGDQARRSVTARGVHWTCTAGGRPVGVAPGLGVVRVR